MSIFSADLAAAASNPFQALQEMADLKLPFSDVNGYTPECGTDDYIAMSASDKMDMLWNKITEDESSGGWAHMAGVLLEGMNETFDTPGDEFACGWLGCRTKDIHCVGNVAKVKFVPSSNQFTGIFQGADHGLLRLSVAKPVDTKNGNMAPGMGLKFLRDGVDSANLVAMYSVDGQDSYNFFQNDWSNHIPDVTSVALLPLAAKFYTATYYIQAVGLSDFAGADQYGTTTDDPVFPFQLRFEPSGEVEFPADEYYDYLQELATIQPGTNVFNVYGWTAPADLGGQEVFIGNIVTDSEMTPSKWGDEHLFIRHQRAEDDIAFRPDWEEYYPKYHLLKHADADLGQLADEVAAAECPFSHLWNRFTN